MRYITSYYPDRDRQPQNDAAGLQRLPAAVAVPVQIREAAMEGWGRDRN
ncbi:hypothetical protein [Arthrobacter sp. 35W]|nr:hypothetical protein [Arthrobacter sp. 35W]